MIERRLLVARAFVREFVRCGYMAAPAWRAMHPTGTEKSSWAHGWQWLRRAEVQDELRRLYDEGL